MMEEWRGRCWSQGHQRNIYRSRRHSSFICEDDGSRSEIRTGQSGHRQGRRRLTSSLSSKFESEDRLMTQREERVTALHTLVVDEQMEQGEEQG
ncbi:hypothetical protein TNCT_242351 [Trichonephila clavata]|uniref:Uncharacterized protein n=1 Tax=Trichonephila clavata TaxID=2740835 RepID=A0A8X6K8T3_TRICU|nr:hypothetical protein TNCT_242351 [Trichonephila clavata]